MLRKVLLVIGVVLLAGALVGVALSRMWAQAAGSDSASGQAEGTCPPGYTYVVSLEPIQAGEQSSKILEQGCQPIADVDELMLEPIRPGEEGWAVEPVIPEGDLVNGIVQGPSGESAYRCVVLLEPIQEGEQFSKASEPVCSRGPIDTINGVSLASSYLVAKFYDGTNYANLLVEYYGPSACSSTISYGVAGLPDHLDNRFASGRAYSNCDHLYVYDLNNYGGPSYSCGANYPSSYALNGEVSSWRTTD